MTTTFYEQGLEKGLEQGLQKGLEKGQRQLLEMQLATRFGPLQEEVRQRLASLPREQIQPLALAVLSAGSLRELGLEG
jgi:flagellar biosynthesis/type III secretory pathway protein FliH